MVQIIDFKKYKQNKEGKSAIVPGDTLNKFLKDLKKHIGESPKRGKREAIVPNGFDDFGGGLFK